MTASGGPAKAAAGIDEVIRWLLERRPELEHIDMDVDLIENRIIDSLSFVDFVYFLEELTGRELRANAKSVNSFRTLRAVELDILTVGNGDGSGA